MDRRRLRARARLARREAGRPLTPGEGAPARHDPRALFEYPRKRIWLSYLLWLVTGLLGGHRFYLGRAGTAAAQFLTGGGFLVWWAVDAFLIPGYVREHNREQEERERAGFPPVALSYLGDDVDTSLDAEPAWAEGRTGTASVVGDAAVLSLAGSCLGAVSAAAILFGLVDVTKDAAVPLLTGAAVGDLAGLWLAATVLTFVSVYAFAVPIGASLARPLLARRPKGELWGLTAWTAVWIAAGALAAG